MQIRNILISGAGIAGLTLAYWLKRFGFNPTIVENHSSLRKGGYIIDFGGVGYEVAEKMGLIPELSKKHHNISEMTFVNDKNERKSGLNVYKFRKLLHFRHFNLLRSELASVLFENIQGGTNYIWNNNSVLLK